MTAQERLNTAAEKLSDHMIDVALGELIGDWGLVEIIRALGRASENLAKDEESPTHADEYRQLAARLYNVALMVPT